MGAANRRGVVLHGTANGCSARLLKRRHGGRREAHEEPIKWVLWWWCGAQGHPTTRGSSSSSSAPTAAVGTSSSIGNVKGGVGGTAKAHDTEGAETLCSAMWRVGSGTKVEILKH